jgi:hypothetical protein
MWKLKLCVKTVAFTIPATIATLDIVGYVASVEGASMQVNFIIQVQVLNDISQLHAV